MFFSCVSHSLSVHLSPCGLLHNDWPVQTLTLSLKKHCRGFPSGTTEKRPPFYPEITSLNPNVSAAICLGGVAYSPQSITNDQGYL